MSRRLLLVASLAGACGSTSPGEPSDVPDAGDEVLDAAGPDAGPSWPFALPERFPVPRLPSGERLTPELAELGRHLFHDSRLSANQTQSCGSCHLQERAFTDGRTVAVGSTGEVLRRNAMSLTNIAYNPTHTWANPLADSLEKQALVPIFAEHPIELGVTGNEEEILGRLASDPEYQAMFAAAFPGEADAVSFPNVVEALAAFERRLISGNSRVDRYRSGDAGALSESEVRGYQLFFTEELECHHCHGGFNFTIAVDYAELHEPRVHFFNNGLYNIAGTGDYPAIDQGLWEFTLDDGDRGRYRPPTLRNIGVTAPYMHDGSVATLEEVLAIYERGGRLISDGPLAGDGRDHPNKSPFVGGFILTEQERADLIAFLRALTDDGFLTDETLSDPFTGRDPPSTMRLILSAWLVLAFNSATGCGGAEAEADTELFGPPTESVCPADSVLRYEDFGAQFMEQYCTRCHASNRTGPDRHGAPIYHDFDKIHAIRAVADHIDQTAAAGPAATNHSMPPDGDRPGSDERRLLGEWLACGAL